MSDGQPSSPPTMSLGGAVFLGVGSMVGAGIFALLGEAGALAGSATWLSFLMGLVVVFLLAYTVCKLSVRFPSRGGLVSFLARGFGDTRVTGVASWLFYIAGLIITTMVALSFGGYATEAFLPDDASTHWSKFFAVVVVVVMALVNRIGPDVVGKVQSAIVVLLLVVFAIFIVATLKDADFDLLARSTYPSLRDIVAAVALTFFAYIGFAVIANAAESLPRPSRDVPVGTYLALAITGVLYILMSIGVFGAMSVEEVIAAGDTALAKAAEPALGSTGYAMMTIAALLATASSVNANEFAASALTSSLAETRQFPGFFGGHAPVFGSRGLTISVGVVSVMALLFDLSAVASIGSAVGLAIFLLVGWAAMKLREETRSSAVLICAAIVLDLVVLVLFSIDVARNEPRTFVAIIVVVIATVIFDALWKSARNRGDSPSVGAT